MFLKKNAAQATRAVTMYLLSMDKESLMWYFEV
jgi:hypothetical protein